MVKAGRIVLAQPANSAAVEHFELLKKQWLDKMERMRALVDDAVDTAAFIKATGQWGVVSGEWSVGSGQWGVGSGQ